MPVILSQSDAWAILAARANVWNHTTNGTLTTVKGIGQPRLPIAEIDRAGSALQHLRVHTYTHAIATITLSEISSEVAGMLIEGVRCMRIAHS